MPKGRGFAPPIDHDGNWFQHRGLPPESRRTREVTTSTGIMLKAPFDPSDSSYPPKPPSAYHHKDAVNFQKTNAFSAHDNRNSFQNHGVYFGDGSGTRTLGKRLTAPTQRQHYTDKDNIKHNSRQAINFDYNTNYGIEYEGNQSTGRPSHRRFPKVHNEGTTGLAKLDTTTTDWFKNPDVPHKTPLHVMAVAQEPFLGHNKWKYSNHGLSKCYPPYDKVNSREPFAFWMVQGPSALK